MTEGAVSSSFRWLAEEFMTCVALAGYNLTLISPDTLFLLILGEL